MPHGVGRDFTLIEREAGARRYVATLIHPQVIGYKMHSSIYANWKCMDIDAVARDAACKREPLTMTAYPMGYWCTIAENFLPQAK
jgi:hypothetical protein